eukprot:1148455-Pelagomonas_calceolata.AAC.6
MEKGMGDVWGLTTWAYCTPSSSVFDSLCLSCPQALEWMLQLAEALAYLHSANPKVIHRDLKLENVSGNLGVADSGCRKHGRTYLSPTECVNAKKGYGTCLDGSLFMYLIIHSLLR